MNEGFFAKLRQVRMGDIGHMFLFLLALLPAAVYRWRRPHLWLLCETAEEAQDNGYWLFRYLCKEQPQVDAVYAIRQRARAYAKVAALGPTVEYGSFKHWIYYLAAQVNISSQKCGKPNAAVCYLLEVTLGLLRNRRVFLQHGIIKDDLPFLHYKNSGFSLFCCGAAPEYAFVRDTFGYPDGVVQHVGLCRFDGLHGQETDTGLVLVVPTWRMWLERKHGEAGQQDFLNSAYYSHWNGLLHSGELNLLLERYDKRLIFCMHRNMGAFAEHMQTESPRIKVLDWQKADIAGLLRKAGTLLTDFSSVYMDFAYMKKPVLYYQFDEDAFRSGHLPPGYFDYERDGFGPVCRTETELRKELERCFQNDCRMAEEYEGRVSGFFTLHDSKNSERTYKAIVKLLKGNGEGDK